MLRNMVKESAAAPLTGTTVTLSGAQPGYTSFTSFGNAAAVYYMITDGTQSEMQAGTVTVGSPNTLSRGTAIWNTAGTTARLNFTGTTTVYCVAPAERTFYADANAVWQAQARRIAGVADGTALTDAATLNQTGWRTVSTTTVSAAAAADFTLPAGFAAYRLEIVSLGVSVNGASVCIRCSGDGGTTFDAAASDYIYTSFYTTLPTSAGVSGVTTSFIDLTGPLSTTPASIVKATITPGTASTQGFRAAVAAHVVSSSPEWRVISVSGSRGIAGVKNAIRLLPTSGTFSAVVSFQGLHA